MRIHWKIGTPLMAMRLQGYGQPSPSAMVDFREVKTMRQRTLLSFAFTAAVALGVASSARPVEASIISVNPATSIVSVGDTFSVSIDIADVTDLFAYQFGFTYDPTVVNVTAVEEGSFLGTAGSTFFSPGTIDNTAGTVTFNLNSLIGAIAGASGGGSLLTFDLLAVNGGTSSLSAVFDPANGDVLLDSLFNPIDFTAAAGSVVVNGSPAPVPEPATLLLVGSALATGWAKRRP
jgi:general secretion pathway protein D